MPPLAEPDLGAADGGADGLDGSAGEAQGNGSMTSREFVVHGSLRVAAAGGCPRRESYTREGPEGAEARGGPSHDGVMYCRSETPEAKRCAVGPQETMCCRSAITKDFLDL